MKMGKKKRKFIKPFAAALDHFIRIKGETNDSVGEAVKYPSKGKAIDQIRNERSDGKYEYRKAIAKHFGYTLDAFIDFGEALILQKNEPPGKPVNVTSLSDLHKALIDKFQQKELALEINSELLTLEAMDPERLKKVLEYIEWQKKKAAEHGLKKRAAGDDSV